MTVPEVFANAAAAPALRLLKAAGAGPASDSSAAIKEFNVLQEAGRWNKPNKILFRCREVA